jgi:hypothetical protein
MLDERERLRETARAAHFAASRREASREWLRPSGTSMRPAIGPGARVQVQFAAVPSLGDIVVVEAGGRHLAHRVVALRRLAGVSHLVIKGDNEAYCDAPVASGDVLGVARAIDSPEQRCDMTIACGGWPAVAIARLSHIMGRGAGRVQRLALRLPPPVRPVAVRAITLAARTISRSCAGLLICLAQFISSKEGR